MSVFGRRNRPSGPAGEEMHPVREAEEAAGAPAEKTPEEKEKAAIRRRRALKRAVPTALITVVYLVFAFFMFKNALDAAAQGVHMSLRYESTPLPKSLVANAQYTMGDPDVETAFTAAYWSDVAGAALSTARGEVKAAVLVVDGDIQSVAQEDYIRGAAPAVLEKKGAALSEGLAWQLFGGTDVVGSTLKWGGAEYTVRGVFRGDTLFMLAQVDAKAAPVNAFEGVELTAGAELEGDPREAAGAYATQAGLGAPDVIISAGMVPGLLVVMAWIPAVVLIVWFAVRLLRLLHHVTYWKRQLVWLAILIAAAFVLPWALGRLPGWVIPTQWSDTEHWSAFFKEINTRITEWLSLRPTQSDVQMKKMLIWQVLLLIPALFAMVSAIRRWSAHMRRKDMALHLAQAQVASEELLPVLLDGEMTTAKAPRDAQAAPEEQDDIQLLMEKHTKKNPMS